MANIIIPDLYLSDSNSFLDDLSKMDCISVYGGYTIQDYAFSQFTTKILEFLVVVYAIHSITSLVESFALRNRGFQSFFNAEYR
jgi:polysaccharide pyruvyl transferase WcaK-like protein